MSNIAKAFENGKAFIPFITCGDPSLDITKEIVIKAEEAGADLIELGIPFSDPTAEGPVIQEANIRALSGGVTTDKVFDLVKELRKTVKVPLVFMTYANVVFSYTGGEFKSSRDIPVDYNGSEKFISKCKEVGIDGLILPDIPFEEKDEFDSLCKKYDLDLMSLIAPTSHERITTIASKASGFVYCVSSLGVTGMRSNITTDIAGMVKLVKEANPNIPAAVGFGISNPEQAAKMASLSDGAIVGSAIVKIIGEHGKDSVPYVYEAIKAMADAVHACK